MIYGNDRNQSSSEGEGRCEECAHFFFKYNRHKINIIVIDIINAKQKQNCWTISILPVSLRPVNRSEQFRFKKVKITSTAAYLTSYLPNQIYARAGLHRDLISLFANLISLFSQGTLRLPWLPRSATHLRTLVNFGSARVTDNSSHILTVHIADCNLHCIPGAEP